MIAFLGLERYRDTLIANLPYGVRKVVELGRALCIEPKLLLLDEPSSGLNVEETEGMGFWIEDIKKDLGITVIMVEHDMNLVRMVSDRVMALNYGKVIALGTPDEVQNHPEVVRAYIGGEAMSRLPRRCSTSPRSRPSTVRSRRSAASACRWRKARSSPCSAPTAPARPRCCAPSPACWIRNAARCASRAATSTTCRPIA